MANRENNEATNDMMLGSLFAGIAFSHARLGNIHAMSHPVSAYYDVAHGVANAILMPTILEFNALADEGKYYEIYRRIAVAPVEAKQFKPQMLCEEVKDLLVSLDIPLKLSDVGVTREYLEQMTQDAMKSGNIAVNPRKTGVQDIMNLYLKAL